MMALGKLFLNHPTLVGRLGVALIIGILAAILYGAGAGGSIVSGVFGEQSAASPIAHTVVALVIALMIAVAWHLVSKLPRRQQIIISWLTLFVLLLLFFYSFDLSFAFIAKKIGFLVSRGVVTTLYISVMAIVIATAIALVGAIAKLSSSGLIYGFASFYTSLFRGLPLLMQIYIIYLGLPQFGFVIGAIPAGVIALSLCYGAYMTEIFRAGIESISKGQWEGATALGLGRGQTMWLVILPQAMRVIIPPTGNQFISMLKDSSLVSVVGVWEIMYLARTLGQTEFRHIEMLITAAMIYWILSIGLEIVQSRIEAHYGRSLRR
ncbi:ABC transporter permease subunit [Mesorhizobium sp. NBSH29]|uniref:amino acid ABC transporter permease n=1 Tax=Mesorhizobium sp. NBSH29 TaxID=2654249 RepID=UPI00189670DE|nr:amino acid ABC transporter permease [Mesorhizobium sp. NBSH29]QPC87196.1 ABC transporter permease subunit [Mesorhizobium sp. NBSH29]